MAATRRLNELIESALDRLDLPPGLVTVALSGGADSAALARLAIESGVDVALLHVNHGFDASRILAGAAARIADRLDRPLTTVEVEVGSGASPEAQARDARYQVFDDVDGPVLTGHTRDDSVETMLINLIRGTGIDGLGGIPYHRPPNVYRPMLEIARSETREIATLAGLEFRDDPMNNDLAITRNRIRHMILPLMRELNPQVDEAMARMAGSLRTDIDYLRGISDGPLSDTLAIAVVTTLPEAVSNRLIQRWLVSHEIAVSADLIGRVQAVAEGRAERQDLEGGRRVERDGAVLRVK